MFKAVKNALITVNKDYSQIIIGDQVFNIPNNNLVKFTKLDLLFKSDFVFKSECSFLNYQTAQDLFSYLCYGNLDCFSQDQLTNLACLSKHLE